jgi:hypothetical protein
MGTKRGLGRAWLGGRSETGRKAGGGRSGAVPLAALGVGLVVSIACSGRSGASPDGSSCAVATDCQSLVCSSGTCQVPTSTDGAKNGDETDIDCGGSSAPPCAVGLDCIDNHDCKSGACAADVCAMATSTDGMKDGDETDVDCGGKNTGAPPCMEGQGCLVAADCMSTLCGTTGDSVPDGKGGLTKSCLSSTSLDGKKDGTETDVDCGGPSAPPCLDGKACGNGKDCASAVCTGNVCAVPTSTDGQKNGDESDVDCGGTSTHAPPCQNGKNCFKGSDCASDVCTTYSCQAPTSTDGVKNGDETDIDCGGTSTHASGCADGKACLVPQDCADGVCTDHVCAAPTACDGVKNGDEGDVDCGGTTTKCMGQPAPRCAAGKGCSAQADCAPVGTTGNASCDYTHHCSLAPSCVSEHGGYSCGSGETGQAGAMHESCCTSLPVPMPSEPGLKVDKYNITTGRMREFITRVNGNVRGWVQQHRPATGFPAAWDASLPTQLAMTFSHDITMAGVYDMLGPYQFGTVPDQDGNRGCTIGAGKGYNGARTFNIPATERSGDPEMYPQDTNDEKTLNCVPFYLLAAFCLWDGGHLATYDELDYAWKGTTPTAHTYPWGNTPVPAGYRDAYPTQALAIAGAMSDPTEIWIGYPANKTAPPGADVTYANYQQNYWFPSAMLMNDYTLYVAPPGRFPKGNGQYGHADLAGNVLAITGTTSTDAKGVVSVTWFYSGSWEVHEIPYEKSTQPDFFKYTAAGGRCAR